jgi:hypothetical protein
LALGKGTDDIDLANVELQTNWKDDLFDEGKATVEIVVQDGVRGNEVVAKATYDRGYLYIEDMNVKGSTRDGERSAIGTDVWDKLYTSTVKRYGNRVRSIRGNLDYQNVKTFNDVFKEELKVVYKITDPLEKARATEIAAKRAAAETHFGKMAGKEGFTDVTIENMEDIKTKEPFGHRGVDVKFTKPKFIDVLNPGKTRTISWLQSLEKKELNDLPGRPIEILKDTDEKMKAINAFVGTPLDPGITNLVVYVDKSDKNLLWAYTANDDWRKVSAEDFGDYTKLISNQDKPVSFKVIPFETNPKDIQSTLEAVARENSKMCFYLPEDPIYLAPYGGTPLSDDKPTFFKGVGNVNGSPRLVNNEIPKSMRKKVLGGTYRKDRFIIKWQDVNESSKGGPHVFVYMDDKKTLLGDGDLDPDGFLGLSIDVKIPENTSGITGREVFNHIFQEVKKWNTKKQINGVWGLWSIKSPKFRDNINSFNEKILKIIAEKKGNRILTDQQLELIKEDAAYEAAAETFTGKMAKENNFCCVTKITGEKNADGTYIDADVKFSNEERSTRLLKPEPGGVLNPRDITNINNRYLENVVKKPWDEVPDLAKYTRSQLLDGLDKLKPDPNGVEDLIVYIDPSKKVWVRDKAKQWSQVLDLDRWLRAQALTRADGTLTARVIPFMTGEVSKVKELFEAAVSKDGKVKIYLPTEPLGMGTDGSLWVFGPRETLGKWNVIGNSSNIPRIGNPNIPSGFYRHDVEALTSIENLIKSVPDNSPLTMVDDLRKELLTDKSNPFHNVITGKDMQNFYKKNVVSQEGLNYPSKSKLKKLTSLNPNPPLDKFSLVAVQQGKIHVEGVSSFSSIISPVIMTSDGRIYLIKGVKDSDIAADLPSRVAFAGELKFNPNIKDLQISMKSPYYNSDDPRGMLKQFMEELAKRGHPLENIKLIE